MIFNFNKKEVKKRMLLYFINLIMFVFFLNQFIKKNITSDKVRYILLIGIILLSTFIIIKMYVKMKRSIVLEISNCSLKSLYFKRNINKESILKIDLLHGHVNSFALILLKNKPTIKIYEIIKKYNHYKYGTPYLINLDEIEGESAIVYQKLLNWK